jgi:hypothetical protein
MMPGYVETRSKVFSQLSLGDIAAATGAEIGPVAAGFEAAHVTACVSGACREYDEQKASLGVKVGVPVVGKAEIGVQRSARNGGAYGEGMPYVQLRAGPELAGVSAKLTLYSLEGKARLANGGVGAGIAWQIQSHKLLAVPQSMIDQIDPIAEGRNHFGPKYRFMRVAYSYIQLTCSHGLCGFSTLDSPLIIVNKTIHEK